MVKNKIKINFITIFAIVFIFGGFMSIFSSILYYNQVKNAKYIQDTIGIVHSINIPFVANVFQKVVFNDLLLATKKPPLQTACC